jgi:hypothetical protein
MKQFALFTLAMGAALAFIPSALADSLGYSSTTPNPSSNVAVDAGSVRFTNQVAESGAFAMTGMIATFSNQNSSAVASESHPRAAKAAVNNNAFTRTSDSGSQFDSLLNFGNAGTGILDKGGVLVDLSGQQLTLLSGGYSSDNRAENNGHFFFADKGSFHPGNSVSGNNGTSIGRAPLLTETPEPGSLILLGTGLLCMALVLFWKSARRPVASGTLS